MKIVEQKKQQNLFFWSIVLYLCAKTKVNSSEMIVFDVYQAKLENRSEVNVILGFDSRSVRKKANCEA